MGQPVPFLGQYKPGQSLCRLPVMGNLGAWLHLATEVIKRKGHSEPLAGACAWAPGLQGLLESLR